MTGAGGSESVIAALDCEAFIHQRIRDGYTHRDVSSELAQAYPGMRGVSTRSVRRFCAEREIHYSGRLSHQQVGELVEQSVSQVYKFASCELAVAIGPAGSL